MGSVGKALPDLEIIEMEPIEVTKKSEANAKPAYTNP
jgi:hypothetical protein